jgi:hypothetical protein
VASRTECLRGIVPTRLEACSSPRIPRSGSPDDDDDTTENAWITSRQSPRATNRTAVRRRTLSLPNIHFLTSGSSAPAMCPVNLEFHKLERVSERRINTNGAKVKPMHEARRYLAESPLNHGKNSDTLSDSTTCSRNSTLETQDPPRTTLPRVHSYPGCESLQESGTSPSGPGESSSKMLRRSSFLSGTSSTTSLKEFFGSAMDKTRNWFDGKIRTQILDEESHLHPSRRRSWNKTSKADDKQQRMRPTSRVQIEEALWKSECQSTFSSRGYVLSGDVVMF